MIHDIALTLLPGLTQMQTLQLMLHLGKTRHLFEHPQEALSDVHPKMRRRVLALLEQHAQEALYKAEQESEFCRQHNIHVLSVNDPDYPRRLAECPDAPAVIYYRGSADLNARHTIAIVGTRRITPYGKDVCRILCADLARLLPDSLIISGLAYGVDIHAHREALTNHLDTVGILAHGLDQIYPAAHRQTACQMLSQGGLITEYVRGTRPFAGNFVRRNRIVAGMSDVVVVVESANKGGALITAQLAFDYDRTTCTFPGRLTDPYSEGCHHLVRDHKAELITSADDIIQMMGWGTHSTSKVSIETELFPELTEKQQKVVDTLRTTDGLPVQKLCILTNLDLPTLHTILFELEMCGVVTLLAGGIYRLLPQVSATPPNRTSST